MMFVRTRGEMDIIPVFGTVVVGSNPAGCTLFFLLHTLYCFSSRVWFSGRMRPCQGRDGSSILPTRTEY